MANDRLRFHISNAPLGFIEFDGVEPDFLVQASGTYFWLDGR